MHACMHAAPCMVCCCCLLACRPAAVCVATLACSLVHCTVLWCDVVYCGVLWCSVVYCGVPQVLDELGRGTATHDGHAIALGAALFLARDKRCRSGVLY